MQNGKFNLSRKSTVVNLKVMLAFLLIIYAFYFAVCTSIIHMMPI